MIARVDRCQRVGGHAEYCILYSNDELPGPGFMELRITVSTADLLKNCLEAAGRPGNACQALEEVGHALIAACAERIQTLEDSLPVLYVKQSDIDFVVNALGVAPPASQTL